MILILPLSPLRLLLLILSAVNSSSDNQLFKCHLLLVMLDKLIITGWHRPVVMLQALLLLKTNSKHLPIIKLLVPCLLIPLVDKARSITLVPNPKFSLHQLLKTWILFPAPHPPAA